MDCFEESRRLINAIDEILLPSLRAAIAGSGWEVFDGERMFVGQNSHIAPKIVFIDDATAALNQTTDDLIKFLGGAGETHVVPEDAITQTAPPAPVPESPDFSSIEEIRDRYIKQLELLPDQKGPPLYTPMLYLNGFADDIRELLIYNALHGLDECLRAQRG